jgi:hypothetical protein
VVAQAPSQNLPPADMVQGRRLLTLWSKFYLLAWRSQAREPNRDMQPDPPNGVYIPNMSMTDFSVVCDVRVSHRLTMFARELTCLFQLMSTMEQVFTNEIQNIRSHYAEDLARKVYRLSFRAPPPPALYTDLPNPAHPCIPNTTA